MRQKRRPALDLICPVCTIVFKRPPSQIKGDNTCCSKQCSAKFRTKSTTQGCSQCGIAMDLRPTDIKRNKKYCSRSCYFASGKHAEALKKANENTPRNYWLGKKRPEMSGEKNPRWNNGASAKRQLAMGQLEYKQWRTAVFERDNYTCQMCQQYGGVLHADHTEKWADNEELRYAVENGRTLCVPCHFFVTFKRKMMPGQRWCNYTAGKRG